MEKNAIKGLVKNFVYELIKTFHINDKKFLEFVKNNRGVYIWEK